MASDLSRDELAKAFSTWLVGPFLDTKRGTQTKVRRTSYFNFGKRNQPHGQHGGQSNQAAEDSRIQGHSELTLADNAKLNSSGGQKNHGNEQSSPSKTKDIRDITSLPPKAQSSNGRPRSYVGSRLGACSVDPYPSKTKDIRDITWLPPKTQSSNGRPRSAPAQRSERSNSSRNENQSPQKTQSSNGRPRSCVGPRLGACNADPYPLRNRALVREHHAEKKRISCINHLVDFGKLSPERRENLLRHKMDAERNISEIEVALEKHILDAGVSYTQTKAHLGQRDETEGAEASRPCGNDSSPGHAFPSSISSGSLICADVGVEHDRWLSNRHSLDPFSTTPKADHLREEMQFERKALHRPNSIRHGGSDQSIGHGTIVNHGWCPKFKSHAQRVSLSLEEHCTKDFASAEACKTPGPQGYNGPHSSVSGSDFEAKLQRHERESDMRVSKGASL